MVMNTDRTIRQEPILFSSEYMLLVWKKDDNLQNNTIFMHLVPVTIPANTSVCASFSGKAHVTSSHSEQLNYFEKSVDFHFVVGLIMDGYKGW